MKAELIAHLCFTHLHSLLGFGLYVFGEEPTQRRERPVLEHFAEQRARQR
jgi:hypothetical protein